MYFLLAVMIGCFGMLAIIFRPYTREKEYVKYRLYNISAVSVAVVIYISFFYIMNIIKDAKVEHFNQGGFIRCNGDDIHYLVTNKDYILRGEYFIKGERVFFLESCSKIK
ncbi:hypothetical protein JHD48_07775 [Sulfurimonas sp. SAG-AH-194-I05]|nr:hypothetical protein [Sulfurimonas sp. SAG-AH-194-I05]MDF1875629.1 hypothetical protein [Sulfurimonas sp. SAG-AH-194-I05]